MSVTPSALQVVQHGNMPLLLLSLIGNLVRDEEVQPPPTRTLSSIVISCLFTLFTCVWCTIRPDIPSPRDSKLRILITKLNIIFWVLVSPEMVVFWSFRQWFEAGRIAGEFKNRGWTRRHAIFLLMGGFMLCQNDQPIQTLSILQFRRLLQSGAIDFPSTTISEIKERGSLHPTLAFLVVLQVTWFTTQCLSRLIEGLLITQLEAMILVLLLANGLILAFTYQKPLDAQYPVQINIKFEMEAHVFDPPPHRSVRQDFRRENETENIVKRALLVERRPRTQQLMTVGRLVYYLLDFTLVWPIRSLYRDFGRLAINMGSNEIPRGTLKVPLFYVPDSSDLLLFVFPVILLGMGVGVVSCLFWSWGHFPSDTARFVWRVNSMTTAAFCALFLVLMAIISLTQLWNQVALNSIVESIADFFIYVGVFVFMIAFLPYILARVVILLESFLCLQSLPREAFEIVLWTNYIPHLS